MKIRKSHPLYGGYSICKTRVFSTSVILRADSSNGSELDNNDSIIGEHGSSSTDFEKYFGEKAQAIGSAYRVDSNSAAISGVSASELENWLQEKNKMLAELNEQREDLYDLHDHLDPNLNPSIVPADITGAANTNPAPAGNTNSSAQPAVAAPNNPVTSDNGTSTNNVTSSSNTTSGFTQDSSDVVDENPSSWEPFDD